jgi:GLPGLI family protein
MRMNRTFVKYLLFAALVLPQGIYAQRIIAECTLEYSFQPDTSLQVNKANGNWGTKKVFIKGNDARVDVEGIGFFQSLIYDKANQQAVVLRVLGSNKFITRLLPADWILENKKFDSLKITYQSATKTIIGYDCKMASILQKDGTEYRIFYTTNIAPSVREFDYVFKDIPGFVLEYEVKQANRSVKYTATRISFSPVAASRFDIPVSGYRILDK